MPRKKTIRMLYGIAFGIISCSFLIAMLGRNILPLGVQKVLYGIGTVWMGYMLYLFIWLLISDLTLLFFKKEIRKRLRIWQIGLGYGLISILLLIGYQHYTHPKIVEKEIFINKSNEKYKNLKVVAVSDLHLGVMNDKKWLQKTVRQINSLQPDMIWIAGDMVDNNVLPLERETMYEELNQLQSQLGTYMCLGNHEYLSGIGGSLRFLQRTNIRLLIDQVVEVDSAFWMIGRDDYKMNPQRKSLANLIASTDSSKPLFLLDHEPYFLDQTAAEGIDFQFSGHTHQGQLWPLSLIVNALFENPYGSMQKGDTHIFVSSGLGLWGPPFRIGTLSEILVFNIHFN